MSEQEGAELRLSAGAMLRQAREAAGLHIGALSVALKVPVKKLEALEADRVDLLPDAVFARALAASVCRTLRIEAEPVLAAFPQFAPPTLAEVPGRTNASFRVSGAGGNRPMLAKFSKPWVMATVALVLGAFVMALLPSIQHGDASSGNVPGAPLPELATRPATLAPVAPALRVDEVSATTATPGAVLAANPQANTEAKPVAGNPLVNSPVPPASTQILVPPGVQDGILVIKTRGPSWVEVTDASGTVQVRKTMVEGENLGVPGRLPMRVILGRAEMAEVQVRGQPIDLTTVSKDNVARFEVK